MTEQPTEPQPVTRDVYRLTFETDNHVEWFPEARERIAYLVTGVLHTVDFETLPDARRAYHRAIALGGSYTRVLHWRITTTTTAPVELDMKRVDSNATTVAPHNDETKG